MERQEIIDETVEELTNEVLDLVKTNSKEDIKEYVQNIIEDTIDVIVDGAVDRAVEEQNLGDTRENKIREELFELNTGERGIVEHTTNILNGMLEGIFIETHSLLQIDIVFDDMPDVVLYSVPDYHGSQFLAIRQDVHVYMRNRDANDKAMTANAQYPLNDRLKIIVRGQKNQNVKFKIRYK